MLRTTDFGLPARNRYHYNAILGCIVEQEATSVQETEEQDICGEISILFTTGSHTHEILVIWSRVNKIFTVTIEVDMLMGMGKSQCLLLDKAVQVIGY